MSVPIVFLLCRYTAVPPWTVYAAMQAGVWIKLTVGAVLVKKGVWLENIIGSAAI